MKLQGVPEQVGHKRLWRVCHLERRQTIRAPLLRVAADDLGHDVANAFHQALFQVRLQHLRLCQLDGEGEVVPTARSQ